MAIAAIVEPSNPITMTLAKPKPLRVCFSYAAYAKNLIQLLRTNIPVEPGLSETEFAAVESSLRFTFPPDLRSILQEGLPVGSGFPNWRSGSSQQLEVLINLPILEICREVSKKGFWLESRGDRPDDTDREVSLAKGLLRKAPVLVPVYRHFYVPSTPCMAGNPVFYVHGGEVKIWSFDLAGFFQQFEFKLHCDEVLRRPTLSNLFNAPAWAATEARKIEFWTGVAEGEGLEASRVDTSGWWSGDLGGCLDEVCLRLREGGWREEDVREMMMIDGCDGLDHDHRMDEFDLEGKGWRVKALSGRLLRAGWSTEDVMDSLGFLEDEVVDGDYWFDFDVW